MPCRGGCAHCRGESCRAQRSWALWVAARRERARLRAREEVREVVGVKENIKQERTTINDDFWILENIIRKVPKTWEQNQDLKIKSVVQLTASEVFILQLRKHRENTLFTVHHFSDFWNIPKQPLPAGLGHPPAIPANFV